MASEKAKAIMRERDSKRLELFSLLIAIHLGIDTGEDFKLYGKDTEVNQVYGLLNRATFVLQQIAISIGVTVEEVEAWSKHLDVTVDLEVFRKAAEAQPEADNSSYAQPADQKTELENLVEKKPLTAGRVSGKKQRNDEQIGSPLVSDF